MTMPKRFAVVEEVKGTNIIILGVADCSYTATRKMIQTEIEINRIMGKSPFSTRISQTATDPAWKKDTN